jgi:hypothetical protein
VGYLRSFPNGHFAEIAQMRLARLLAEDERLAAEKRKREEKQRLEQERIERERARIAEDQRLAVEKKRIEQATHAASPAGEPAAGPSPQAAAAARSRKPMLDIRAGVPVPTLIAPSANPFSAGRYPLDRIFTVGDRATFIQTDILTGIEERTYSPRVTRGGLRTGPGRIQQWQHDYRPDGQLAQERTRRIRFPGAIHTRRVSDRQEMDRRVPPLQETTRQATPTMTCRSYGGKPSAFRREASIPS